MKRTPPTSDINAIAMMLQDYFDGLYEADTGKLRSLFHERALLEAPGLRRSRQEWLHAVANRPVPKQRNDPYRFKILSIEHLGDQVMAKVECALLDNLYIDFLGFLKEDGRWQIVNKMYATAASTEMER